MMWQSCRRSRTKAALTGSPSFPATFPSVDLSAYIAGAADKYGVDSGQPEPQGGDGH